jgi:TonB family protein
MHSSSGLLNSVPPSYSRKPTVPKLLVELEPGHRIFLRNLGDMVLRRQPLPALVSSRPGPFWSDVFVTQRVPWWGFLESGLWHAFVLAALWAFSQFWTVRVERLPRSTFRASDVIYYTPSEYLPPIDTGSSPARVPQKGEPEFAKQPIISVPPEADNRTQTIITPPNIKLNHEVPVPNIVAWNSAAPAVPLAATSSMRRGTLDTSAAVVAPAPDVQGISGEHSMTTPQAAVIAPPPSVQSQVRNLGELNVGHSDVVAPAPQLPVGEQRALGGAAQTTFGNSQVVPPPPSLQGARNGVAAQAGALQDSAVVGPPPAIPGNDSVGGGQLIALGIHPSVGPPPANLAGNRRGTFAATPEGKAGAAGTPDIKGDGGGQGHGGNGRSNGAGAGSGNGSTAGVPPGVFVGAGPKNATSSATAGDPSGSSSGSGNGGGSGSGGSDPAVVADNHPMRVTVNPHKAMETPNAPSALERQVFGDRRSYSMILNMPNLNSAGGSWIIRFAELKQSQTRGELIAPEATHKVDPGYPMELMRQNVQGTVTLYAIIHTDGSVGNVRILNGADERLDALATRALARWQFRPALRDGNPIDLEAVFMIPFRIRRSF